MRRVNIIIEILVIFFSFVRLKFFSSNGDKKVRFVKQAN